MGPLLSKTTRATLGTLLLPRGVQPAPLHPAQGTSQERVVPGNRCSPCLPALLPCQVRRRRNQWGWGGGRLEV